MGILILIAANLLFPFIAAGYLIYFFLTPRRGLLAGLKTELPQRFGSVSGETISGFAGKRGLWIHAASVGEVRSTAGILKRLAQSGATAPVLISTSTAAGRAEGEKLRTMPELKHLSIFVSIAPLDFFPLVRATLKKLSPSSIIIIETELWPNFLSAAKSLGIPVCVVNGRMSAKSARTYSLIKPLAGLMMSKITFACLQSGADRDRYISLGLAPGKTAVTGNIKYDLLNPSPSRAAEVEAIINRLGWTGSFILVCGSTHPSEETALIKLWAKLSPLYPGLRMVIAPRHIERTPQIVQQFKTAQIPFLRLSELQHWGPNTAPVLLADAMGWLTSFYARASLCFVGGTIENKGGHNLLEPAIMGKPVIFGPHTGNTPDVAAALLKNGGGLPVSPDNIAETAEKFIKDSSFTAETGQKAERTALSFRGAEERTFAKASPYFLNHD